MTVEPKLRYVCPWCGSKFNRRGRLAAHWLRKPECNRNKYAQDTRGHRE